MKVIASDGVLNFYHYIGIDPQVWISINGLQSLLHFFIVMFWFVWFELDLGFIMIVWLSGEHAG